MGILRVLYVIAVLLLVVCNSHAATTFAWDQVENATGYKIYQGNAQVYACDGSDTTFDFTFSVTDGTELSVYQTTLETLVDYSSYLEYPAWATSTSYVVGDRVIQSGSYYLCIVEHTSNVFADDLSAGYWTDITPTTGYYLSCPDDNCSSGGTITTINVCPEGSYLYLRDIGAVNLKATINGGDTLTYTLKHRSTGYFYWVATAYDAEEESEYSNFVTLNVTEADQLKYGLAGAGNKVEIKSTRQNIQVGY